MAGPSAAPVKTASRIDQPQPFAQLPAGTVAVAGVAWAQGRGISAVQVDVDGRGWQDARLLPTASTDTWTQWAYDWRAPAGAHSLRVRAVDGRGDVQTGDRATPFPDGATGWHTIAVTAELMKLSYIIDRLAEGIDEAGIGGQG